MWRRPKNSIEDRNIQTEQSSHEARLGCLEKMQWGSEGERQDKEIVHQGRD